MPQDSNLVNKALEKILQEYIPPKPDQPQLTLEQKNTLKEEMCKKMRDNINTLSKKNQITEAHAQNALTAIDFYEQHVAMASHHSHPKQILNELLAIDFSKEVKIQRLKPGRIITQMQAQDSLERVGNFYAEGVLPDDFGKQASKSGIGVQALSKEATTEDKSVYQSKITKTSTFLQSTAAPMPDTWSLPGVPQHSHGGGAQFRIASADRGNLERFDWGELTRSHEVGQEGGKRLKGGVVVTDKQTHSKSWTEHIREEPSTGQKDRGR